MEHHPLAAGRFILAMVIGGGLGFPAGLTLAQEQAPETEQLSAPESPGLFDTNLRPVAEPAAEKGELLTRYRAHQRQRSEMERELRKLRAEYFRAIRNPQIRQAGIAKLREYTDPVIFPSLIEIFARDGDDVRGAILDHLVDQQHDDADTVVAWTAIFDKDKDYRALATQRLQHRLAQAGGPTPKISSVIAEGLRRSRDEEVASAAELAAALRIADAIPMLINAQATARGSGAAGRETSLAWILVGQQQAYVADLTPVVGNHAVAFDPQLAVVTTGTVLRVIDAVVVTYRVDVHNALVRLSSDLWGRPTGGFGYDGRAWANWYTKEFLPYWKAKQAEERTAAARVRKQQTERDGRGTAPPSNADPAGDQPGGGQ